MSWKPERGKEWETANVFDSVGDQSRRWDLGKREWMRSSNIVITAQGSTEWALLDSDRFLSVSNQATNGGQLLPVTQYSISRQPMDQLPAVGPLLVDQPQYGHSVTPPLDLCLFTCHFGSFVVILWNPIIQYDVCEGAAPFKGVWQLAVYLYSSRCHTNFCTRQMMPTPSKPDMDIKSSFSCHD